MEKIDASGEITKLMKTLNLPTFAIAFQSVAEQFEKEGRSNIDYLYELAFRESEHRYQKRIEKLIKAAQLPRDKLLCDFEVARIPGLAPS